MLDLLTSLFLCFHATFPTGPFSLVADRPQCAVAAEEPQISVIDEVGKSHTVSATALSTCNCCK
jgi:hypothetical protein